MIKAICAVGNQWQIGLDGKLPWERHEADMEWFREITLGLTMVAGHKTYEGIKHINWRKPTVLQVDEYKLEYGVEYIIIGGAKTYRRHAKQVTQLYLSRIDYDGPADTLFPVDAFTPEQIQGAIWRPVTHQKML